MSILGFIGIVLFVLFCAAMVWQINSDMKETSRVISRGYGFANVTHSAKVFEKTGVDLMGDIDYLADDHTPVSHKKNKPRKKTKNSSFKFSL